MEFPKPTEHHRALDRLVGDWLYVTSTGMEDYDPEDPLKRWTEKVRSVGGLWVIAEGQGGMGSAGMSTMIMTLGYDPRLGHYVGSWIGSMMDKFWTYKGWTARHSSSRPRVPACRTPPAPSFIAMSSTSSMMTGGPFPAACASRTAASRHS